MKTNPTVVLCAEPPDDPALAAHAAYCHGRGRRCGLEDCPDCRPSPADVQLYRVLLEAVGRYVEALDAVMAAHADCPDCELCRDAYGQEYVARIFEDAIESCAPPSAYWRGRRGRYDDLPAPRPQPQGD